MVKVFFTRHAQTIRNIDGIIQGNEHGDLSNKGAEQAKRLAKRIKKEKINNIVSSDSLRCKMTINEIINKNKCLVNYTTLLREKDNGDWIGKEIKKMRWDDLGDDFEKRKVPNGESLVEVRERGRKFIKDLISKYKNSNEKILVVSHGAFLKILLGDLIGMNLKDSIFKLFIDHCSLTLVDFSDNYKEKCQLKYLNETEFLGDSRNWMEMKNGE